MKFPNKEFQKTYDEEKLVRNSTRPKDGFISPYDIDDVVEYGWPKQAIPPNSKYWYYDDGWKLLGVFDPKNPIILLQNHYTAYKYKVIDIGEYQFYKDHSFSTYEKDEFLLLSHPSTPKVCEWMLSRGLIEVVKERIRLQSHNTKPQDVIYQQVATALGRGVTKTLLFLLVKRVPLEELFELTERFPEWNTERILRYVSGTNFNETQSNCYYGDRLIPPTTRWVFFGDTPIASLSSLAKWVDLYGKDPVAWVKSGCDTSEFLSPEQVEFFNSENVCQALQECFNK